MSEFGDKGIGYITIGKGICNKCKHVHKGGQTCDAFPRGIPQLILTGKIDHRKPVPDDNGIQFEERSEVRERG